MMSKAGDGEARIRNAFENAHKQGRGALVTYLMGGDPGPGKDRDYLQALADGGADVIEVGIPFSDPIADGPTIQRAAVRALQAGTHPQDVFATIRALRESGLETPIVVMTYANIPYTMGYARFARTLAESGVDGAIIADMPVEEAAPLSNALADQGRALVLLAAPLTKDARLKRVAEETRGFLYLVGSFGTTGAREGLAPETLRVLDGVKPVAKQAGVPLAVGFGVSRKEHVKSLVEHGADGVVVGSALVEQVERQVPAERITQSVKALREGCGHDGRG